MGAAPYWTQYDHYNFPHQQQHFFCAFPFPLQDNSVTALLEVQTFENGFQSEMVPPLRVDCLTTQ